MTFADRIIRFNLTIKLQAPLPRGVRAMNPLGDRIVRDIMSSFYRKFYRDGCPRHAILGINPGRFGAGSTGIPFTDTKRLNVDCGIPFDSFRTHEPSSVFIYDMIREYGGVSQFYSQFFITSLCPLGFVRTNHGGKEVNYNFYDDPKLEAAVTPFIVRCLRKQISFGIQRDVAFLLGAGKNFKFFSRLNESHRFFEKIVPLEHPRFIMQYRQPHKREFIRKYLTAFDQI